MASDSHPSRTIDEWREYVSTPKFKADVAEAARLLEAGDIDGLAAFASRNADERAWVARLTSDLMRPTRRERRWVEQATRELGATPGTSTGTFEGLKDTLDENEE